MCSSDSISCTGVKDRETSGGIHTVDLPCLGGGENGDHEEEFAVGEYSAHTGKDRGAEAGGRSKKGPWPTHKTTARLVRRRRREDSGRERRKRGGAGIACYSMIYLATVC